MEDTTRRRLIVAAVWLLLATAAAAQDAAQLVAAGDAEAAADLHTRAIANYAAAIAREPGRRPALLHRLALQYLWSDQAGRAVELLGEHLEAFPEDCAARLARALALSWDGRLGAAFDTYLEAADRCPEDREEAWLGAARVRRWQDRPSRADRLYTDVARSGSPTAAQAARIGIGLDDLVRDDNRRARERLTAEIEGGTRDAGAFAGAAVAALRLGRADEAQQVLRRAEALQVRDPALSDLGAEIDRRSRPSVRPALRLFADRDGTRYRAVEATSALGEHRGLGMALTAGTAELWREGEALSGRWAGLTAERRFDASWAVDAGLRVAEWPAAEFRPLLGEMHAVWTPTDRLRLDASLARVTIDDNLAALRQQLVGDSGSLGFDVRVAPRTTVSAACDRTEWSTGNHRGRYRLRVEHRFEGVPRLTLEWPSLFQTYDRGFDFALFSPRRYLETGPALNLYRRFDRAWSGSLYLRLGMQREEERPWAVLGTARAALERDLAGAWGMRLDLGWSNSNVESTTGFERLSTALSLARRF